MAKVTDGFFLGTKEGLTFYQMDGKLYVRQKSSLSGRKVKESPRFKRTMQSAGELGRASAIASKVYSELRFTQRKMVYVLYKKMTGVAKKALHAGRSEEAAERKVREYLVTMGVVKKMEVAAKKKVVGVEGRVVAPRGAQPLFAVFDGCSRKERIRRKRGDQIKKPTRDTQGAHGRFCRF